LRKHLQHIGVWRTRAQNEVLIQRARVRDRVTIDTEAMLAEYVGGQSINACAAKYGCSTTMITRRIRDAGVARRDQAESNRLMMAGRTPEENSRNVRAAHDAVRGVPQTMEHRVKIAKSVASRGDYGSPYEGVLARAIANHGLVVTPQAAVGPYNVDLRVGSVAVEVFGGSWHRYGRQRARFPERSRYLLNAGLRLIVVWCNTTNHLLTVRGADEVVAFIQQAGVDPANRGQYRMIWGGGEPASIPGFEFHEWAGVPALRGGLDAG
jgi:hypothetical protein